MNENKNGQDTADQNGNEAGNTADQGNTAGNGGDTNQNRQEREARRSDIVARLSAGNLPANERTDLENELAELDKELQTGQA